MTSVVLIIPGSLRDDANRLAYLKGWGPECYTVPLTDGSAPVSHWGLRTTVQDGFLAEMGAAAQGIMPEIDMTPEAFFGVVQAVVFDAREDAVGHFTEVIAASGLSMVEVGE